MKEIAAIDQLSTNLLLARSLPRRERSGRASCFVTGAWAWLVMGSLVLSTLVLTSCSDSEDGGEGGNAPALVGEQALDPTARMEAMAAKSGWPATRSKIEHELSKAPSDTIWIALAARAEMEVGEFDTAGNRLIAALGSIPDDPALNTERGVFEFSRADYAETVRVLQSVVEGEPKNARAQEFLGRALEFESLIMMGSRGIDHDVLKSAIEALEASVKHGETSSRLVALALALERAQRIDDALLSHQRAVEIDAECQVGWHGVARLQTENGELEMAGRAFIQALRYGENDAATWLSYGLLLEQEGDEAKAQMVYGNAIRADGALSKAYYRLAVLLGRAGEKESAAKYMESYERLQQMDDDLQAWRFRVRSEPKDDEAVFQLGIAYARLQKWEDSLPWFERSIGRKPQDPRAHFQLGRALRNLEQPEEALRSLARAVELNPGHMPAHRMLPQIANQLGEYSLAEASFEALANLEPTNPDHWFNLGQARRQVSTPERALEAFDQCLLLNPSHLSALEMVTRVELGLGRLDDARAHLDSLLSYNSMHSVGQMLAQELSQRFAEREEQ